MPDKWDRGIIDDAKFMIDISLTKKYPNAPVDAKLGSKDKPLVGLLRVKNSLKAALWLSAKTGEDVCVRLQFQWVSLPTYVRVSYDKKEYEIFEIFDPRKSPESCVHTAASILGLNQYIELEH